MSSPRFRLVAIPLLVLEGDGATADRPPSLVLAEHLRTAGYSCPLSDVAVSYPGFAVLTTATRNWIRAHHLPADVGSFELPVPSRSVPRGMVQVPVAP
jgi:hypothetical protein